MLVVTDAATLYTRRDESPEGKIEKVVVGWSLRRAGMTVEILKTADELRDGDIVTRPVFSFDGAVLIDKDAVLTDDTIHKLVSWKIPSVFVQVDEQEAEEASISWEALASLAPETIRTDQEREAEVEERLRSRPPVRRVMVDPEAFAYDRGEMKEAKRVVTEAHRHALRETKKAVATIARRDKTNVASLRKMVMGLVDTGLSNTQVMSALVLLSHFDDDLLAHSVAGAVYSILTGYTMGLSPGELYELAECVLLHDIGMSHVPTAIWHKKGEISADEKLQIQKHTIWGADILHDAPGVSFMAELVAYQHHERFDGSGYPKGRKRIAISEFARITALTDVYAAMTAARPYRVRMLAYDAMNYVLSAAATLFDPFVVKAFLRCMALYPIGSQVELSSGAHALVVAANPLFPLRPQVKIVVDEKGAPTGDAGDVVNLLIEKNLGIVRAIAQPRASRAALWKAL